jgi:hypothetical protein
MWNTLWLVFQKWPPGLFLHEKINNIKYKQQAKFMESLKKI